MDSDYSWDEIDPELQVTISIGLNGDLHLENFEQMLMAADTKLYKAKNAGRNQVCY
ncbi:MAG: PleD family two-component response regulator [Gammaproteobacteria bacterium]|jgi:two-component system, cell cycle response regulator